MWKLLSGKRTRSQPFTLPDERQYRAHPALAQSSVKYILSGVNQWRSKKNFKFDYSKAIAIGSVVDAMLTDKPKLKDLNIVPTTAPKGKIGECIKYMLKGHSLEDAYVHVQFKRDSIETVRQKIDSEPYYYAMLNLQNKERITIMEPDYQIALDVYNSLTTHPFTRFYCREEYPEGITHYNQLAIVFNYKGRELKALLDRVIVNETDKEVYPIDYKTTEYSTQNFRKPFFMMKYDVQAYWYTQACMQYFKGYKIKPFMFVVESTSTQGCPLVYEVSKDTMKEAKQKVNSAIETYEWHLENGFEYDRHIIQNNGKLKI